VAEVFGLERAGLVPVKTVELKQKAGRPLAGGLSVAKAQGVLRTALRGAEAGLRAMREVLAAEGKANA